jgi:hypothetical protein
VTSDDKPHAGDRVILIALPPGFVDDLPEEDQRSLTAMIGKSVMLVGYDEHGRAELQFAYPIDARTDGSIHKHATIWVGPNCIARVG